MEKISANCVILGLFLLFGPFSGKAAPRLDPSRPWLKPGNNWGQGWGSITPRWGWLKPPSFEGFDESPLFGRSGPSSIDWSKEKVRPRRLDPTRPWLKPGNNWGQGWGSNTATPRWGWWKPPMVNRDDLPVFQGFDESTLFGRSGSSSVDWSKVKIRPRANWGRVKTRPRTNLGHVKVRPRAQGRRLDPTRPWLKPENNWGQGWGSNELDGATDESMMPDQGGRMVDPNHPWLTPGNNWGR